MENFPPTGAKLWVYGLTALAAILASCDEGADLVTTPLPCGNDADPCGNQEPFEPPVVLLPDAAEPQQEAAPPPALIAAYWEIRDGYSALTGLKERLDETGWQTVPLPLDIAPDTLGVDLIAFGSFVSQDPGYAAYLNQNKEALQRFVETGGTLLQFTQADQTETQPAFLPPTLTLTRTDTDLGEVFALDLQHPLVRNLPTSDRLDGLIELPSPTPVTGFASRPACWDCPISQTGFHVIAAGRRDGEFPALLEAASTSGLGRIIVSGLHLDKTSDAAGNVVVEPQTADASLKFFNNLFHYVERLKRGNLPAPAITAPYVRPAAQVLDANSTTIVVFPDTQNYSFSRPGLHGEPIFAAQMAWANANLSALKIAFLLNLGDIVERNIASEWTVAAKAYGLFPAKQPLLLTTGNHDCGHNGSGASRSGAFGQFFPLERFTEMPTFGGNLKEHENSFHLLTIHGEPWIIMGLEWAPRDSVLAWAKEILAKHQDRRAIIVTHAYMFSDETRYDFKKRSASQPWNPHAYWGDAPGSEAVNDGQEIWDTLVAVSPNVRMVLSGHVAKEGIGRMVSKNLAGHEVHQMAFNYQDYPQGGGGFLRILEFMADKATVRVHTYSPVVNQNLTDDQNQFQFTLTP